MRFKLSASFRVHLQLIPNLMRRPISTLHPALYNLRVWQKAQARHLRDWRAGASFAREIEVETLPFIIKRHQSLLRRKLGDSDPILQENKVTNLEIARRTFDGILILPGQTWSFWNCVGDATSKKGYLEGLKLSRGEVKTGVGGGLCQLGNLLLWMAWHSPLVVCERITIPSIRFPIRAAPCRWQRRQPVLSLSRPALFQSDVPHFST
jgi:vancomycin resistance protein VanW